MSRKTYFYALLDPVTEEMCYIGRTRSPSRRLKQHCYKPNNFKGNVGMCLWISSLSDIGLRPIMIFLDTRREGDRDNKSDAKIESELIIKYWNDGHPLLNRHRTILSRRFYKEMRERCTNAICNL